MLASAGANGNNCSFHCLAHTWHHFINQHLSQPHFLVELIKAYPIYHDILQTTNEVYALNLPNITSLIELNNALPHPYDRELFWGRVFREVLAQHLPEERSRDECAPGKLIAEEDIGLLASLMGAKLTVYGAYHHQSKKQVYESFSCAPKSGHAFEVKLYHTHKGGGHYDFDLGSQVLNKEHTSQFTYDDDTNLFRPLFPAQSLLWSASNEVGLNHQLEAAKDVLATLSDSIGLISTFYVIDEDELGVELLEPYHKSLMERCGALGIEAQTSEYAWQLFLNTYLDPNELPDWNELDLELCKFIDKLTLLVEQVDMTMAQIIDDEPQDLSEFRDSLIVQGLPSLINPNKRPSPSR